MPRLRFASNVVGSIDAVPFHLEALVLDATLQSLSAREAVLTFRPGSTNLTYIATGLNLTSTPDPGGGTSLSGLLTGLRVEPPSGLLVEIDRLFLPLDSLTAAAEADRAGSDPGAVEEIVLGLDWSFRGAPPGTFQPRDAVNNDGIVLNMRGDDTVILEDGADTFWLGDGHDLARGGGGDDGLAGGNGDDILFGVAGADALEGDAGNDILIGGAEGDLLRGGSGNDRLVGESGVDMLEGGTGNDLLLGGDGEDTFRFFAGDGFDVIADFEAEADLIQIAGESGEVSVIDTGAGALIRGDNVTVLVLNTSADDLDDSNLLLL
ncbi:MAG: calcium-binding protein [Pseudomonadota bacterium]